MGLLSTPPGDKWLKRYSLFLKFEGQVFGGIFLVGYIVKWGVAWHDAGEPGRLDKTNFSAVGSPTVDPTLASHARE